MRWIIAIICGLLWTLAMASSYSFGGYIHLLIVAAVAVVAYQVIKDRRDSKFKKGV
jgi:hypothetical protein